MSLVSAIHNISIGSRRVGFFLSGILLKLYTRLCIEGMFSCTCRLISRQAGSTCSAFACNPCPEPNQWRTLESTGEPQKCSGEMQLR